MDKLTKRAIEVAYRACRARLFNPRLRINKELLIMFTELHGGYTPKYLRTAIDDLESKIPEGS